MVDLEVVLAQAEICPGAFDRTVAWAIVFESKDPAGKYRIEADRQANPARESDTEAREPKVEVGTFECLTV